ncbi:DUF3576 domain-containing protein [Pseudoroseomonas wenyumeiae]|uniref:DUF3576 domain-containing protein n=1 Tax=Teichococcus wenyumeiae TaxID=2478470 RepID=A0A3A9JTR4_9PROT|nr:DUF3576 domain-containing protein [Pseudoroseomonas wenyumeiae]RKK02389.1 DUF3576 domain-containing protein [Pseudoroseomonas wenyumeiae]RMI27282.1 DUF3576 domain-containing protein [Pseudoroseomonas wenyumeiae]
MRKFLAFGLLLPVLAGCGYGRPVGNDEYYDDSRRARVQGRLGGSDGILLLGTDRSQRGSGDQDGAGLGVNAYLWRATLDTLSFLPLSSADPFGGVIITDWYAPPASPDERFRATAYILGRQLRSDGVRVTVFRQVRQGGGWIDAPASASTATDLENQVLARARELRSLSTAAR